MSNPHMSNAPSGESSSTRNAGPPPNGQSHASASRSAPPAASATTTITITESPLQQGDEVLPLTLRPRPQVTWDEGVVNNEGLGRKSSKRCCIFHKQRAFGESSTDSSDDDNGNNSEGSSSSGGPGSKPKPIARKKIGSVQPSRVPDYQRFHA